ncbi:MAG: hypothetical protein ABW123_17925 [Cystobacter sp.]
MALLLSVLLASCGTTRHATPSSAEELDHLVLVLKKEPDGQVTPDWLPAEGFDFKRYRHRSSAEGRAGRIVFVTSPQSDCYSQYLECYQQCREIPVPPDFNQYLHDFGPRAGHDRYCSEKCMPKYTECLRAQGQRPQEFTTAGMAVNWLKRHHESVLVGSLVVIAGVVFVTVSAGAGVVILAPLVLVSSSEIPVSSHIAAALP